MDKVLVLGALEELGLEMTACLLDEGYEVRGIHLQMGEETLYNERRLGIGRNANYEEIGLKEWIEQEDVLMANSILFLNGLDENIKAVLSTEKGELKNKLLSISSKDRYSIVFIHPFTEWEKRDELELKGNVRSFFVSFSKGEHSGRSVNMDKRMEFQSIFKAIINLVF